MLLERTISQLDIGVLPEPQARELGRLGYLQWLGALPGGINYHAEARKARALALPLAPASTAVAVFCDLLLASLDGPMAPLELSMPKRSRRGGARARRRRVL